MAVSASAKRWTLREMHRLPDDGNKYELVRGELFVTPPPSQSHETVIARLTLILVPYVLEHKLGLVFHARAVVRRRGSETEPDLYVSEDLGIAASRDDNDWTKMPTPSLVVEVSSRSTWRRDLNEKRAYYLEDVGVAEYWMVDRESRTIRVARPDKEDVALDATLRWNPAGASAPLVIEIPPLFD